MKKTQSWARWLLLALVIALAGCAATSTPTTAHPCSGQSFTMQCALAKLPAPSKTVGASSSTKSGIDFAWSCPSPVGHGFGASYYSLDTSKNWTLSCVNAYHAAGAATVGVYEGSANESQQGYNAGFTAAFNARRDARSVGEPDNRPIDYATDCDCTGASILPYYQGVDAGTASLLHITHAAAVNLVGIYGGYNQVSYVFSHGAVGHTNWQTYAWSGGLWLPASIAPLEQWLNGSAVDYDRALLPDYGQFPYKVIPPGPTPKQVRHLVAERDGALHAYRFAGCKYPVLTGPALCHTDAAAVIAYQVKIPGKRPVCWGKRAQVSAPVCQIVRPEVSILSRARNASEHAYERNNCAGPATFGDGVHTPQCNTLRQRQNYFLNRAYAVFKAWA